jgi:hypothetical protein
MKPALVSLILPLVFLSPPNQGLPTIVVMGRVTNAATSAGSRRKRSDARSWRRVSAPTAAGGTESPSSTSSAAWRSR